MFFHKKKQVLSYDRENLEPVIRCSICTGEETAGFRNLHTGHFTEVQLLRSDEDLRDFMETYAIGSVPRRIY